MFEFIFLLHNFIYVILAIQVSAQFGYFSFVLLDADFLLFQLLFKFDNSFILFKLPSCLLLFLTFSLFLCDFVHFGCELFELSFEFDVLFNEFSLSKLLISYAPFSAI